MHTIDNGIKENFFNYEGRLNRKRYLFRNLALFGIGFALYIIIMILFIIAAGIFFINVFADRTVFDGKKRRNGNTPIF